jgi:hypothetical protein
MRAKQVHDDDEPRAIRSHRPLGGSHLRHAGHLSYRIAKHPRRHPEIEQPSEIVGSPDLDIEPWGTSEEIRNEIRGVPGELSAFEQSNDGAYADAVEVDELACWAPAGRTGC